nr:glycoside hydrolase family 15 protein [Motilibacter deserti]
MGTTAQQLWQDWTAQCDHDGEWDDAVRRSLVGLEALAHAPTGGIVAAATTSLPEQLGGPHNWEYRLCWLRDATFTLQALLGTGYIDQAKAWREWLLRAVAGDPPGPHARGPRPLRSAARPAQRPRPAQRGVRHRGGRQVGNTRRPSATSGWSTLRGT